MISCIHCNSHGFYHQKLTLSSKHSIQKGKKKSLRFLRYVSTGNTNCLKVKFSSRVRVCNSDFKEVATISLKSEFSLSALPGKYLLSETEAACSESTSLTHVAVIYMHSSVLQEAAVMMQCSFTPVLLRYIN